MRLLIFNVESQQIYKDPACDFNNIVAGTNGYLRAKFTFSDKWNGYTKVASFWRGSDEHACFINSDGMCDIPSEVLTGATFRVSVTGQKVPSEVLTGATSRASTTGQKDHYRLTTNKILVRQEVSR